MIKNQRGGIISSMFLIPIGIALMAGFFFLGFYVGKHQSKTNQNEIVVPLPEIVSKNLPEKEEFTFYKTLTDNGNKTVSIELKTKTADENLAPESRSPDQAIEKSSKSELKQEQKPEAKSGKPAASGKVESKQQISRNEPRLRYTLQIASYQEKEQADEDAKKLKKQGYAAFVKSTEIQGKGKWYRVRLGSFANKISAEKLRKEFQAKTGVSPFITIE